jgi:very-short-patch-repair endonuclease
VSRTELATCSYVSTFVSATTVSPIFDVSSIVSELAAASARRERSTRGSWAAFLKAQWGAVAATDFFSVEVLTWTGIGRFHVFFVIDLKSRAVEIAGITHDLHQAWVQNTVRSLLD